ncbi:MAG: diaminopimelate dehydrogenase [Halanaerobium sp.]|nr:diaminopimelate dehydrogenase [Halanaerobium sp.]
MKKDGLIRVAVMGYGNVSKGAIAAINAATDMELAGVVEERDHRRADYEKEAPLLRFFAGINEVPEVDVVVLGVPTRLIKEKARALLAEGINTVDSFDIHGQELIEMKKELSGVAIQHGSVGIISAGWDPGTDSVVRAIMETMAPRGITYTNFGPGMSMGHTVAVKHIPGVQDALSLTIPKGTGLHRRLVYISLAEGADFQAVKELILHDPYFINDETYVEQVDCIQDIIDMGHGVVINRKGVAGKNHNQLLTFEARISNPEVTGQVMVSAARAAVRQKAGIYTMLEIPPVDFLAGNREEIIKHMV